MSEAIPDVNAEEGEEHLGPAIVDGTLQYVSPSQIEQFEECERKWAFRKIEHAPEDESPTLEKARLRRTQGTTEHKSLELYLKGAPTALTEAATFALPHLPVPGPDLEVEAKLKHVTLAGLRVIGSIDLRNRRGELPLVHDHKFKGESGYKRKLKEEELARSVQLTIYGADTAAETGATNVVYKHLYVCLEPTEGKRKGRYFKVKPVTVTVSVDSIAVRLLEIESTVERMKVAAAAKKATELRPTFTRLCEWCSYKSRCPQSATEQIQMALSDLLKPSARPAVTVIAESSNVGGTPTPPAEVKSPAVASGILPPEVAKARFEVKDESTRPDAEVKAERDAIAQEVAQNLLQQTAAVLGVTVDAVKPGNEALLAAEQAEKPKRTRRTKAEMEAARAAEGAVTPAQAAATLAGPAVAELASSSPSVSVVSGAPSAARVPGDMGTLPVEPARLELYVDCIPVVGWTKVAVPLEFLIEEISAEIRKAANVGDIGLIEYAKGPGILAGELRRRVKAGLTGVFFGRSGSPVNDAAIAVLMTSAAVVVRGLK